MNTKCRRGCPKHDEQPFGFSNMFADTHFSVLLVLLVAVAGPLLAELPVGFRVPAVVLEVILGIIIGPQVLGLVHFDASWLRCSHSVWPQPSSWQGWNSNSKEFAAGPCGLR